MTRRLTEAPRRVHAAAAVKKARERKGPSFETELEEAKAKSAAQLLFRCARRLDAHALRTLPWPEGSPRPRPAHTALLPHVDLDGTRITEIANRLGVSKQAVGQLVDELEAMGLLERIPDPSDGRAKLVCFTEAGRRSLLLGLGHLQSIEADLKRALGARRFDALREALTALDLYLDELEPEG